jgi:hypothetical protein
MAGIEKWAATILLELVRRHQSEERTKIEAALSQAEGDGPLTIFPAYGCRWSSCWNWARAQRS